MWVPHEFPRPGTHQPSPQVNTPLRPGPCPFPSNPHPPAPHAGPLPPRAGQTDTKGRCRRGSPLPLPASALPGAQRPRSGLQGPEGSGRRRPRATAQGQRLLAAAATEPGCPAPGPATPAEVRAPAGATGRRGGSRPLKRMLGGCGRGKGPGDLDQVTFKMPTQPRCSPAGRGARGAGTRCPPAAAQTPAPAPQAHDPLRVPLRGV